jgi:predicted nucleotidyltransferase
MRKAIKSAIQKKLWSLSGGYCQNPACNKYLFIQVDNEHVNIANMAHIIGLGKHGPRSEYEICNYADKNGFDNLLMLCLECHHVVDQLEKQFTVEQIKKWKVDHEAKIGGLFIAPTFKDEKELLQYIDNLLEDNKAIFEAYGPFSDLALEGEGGDVQVLWKRKCLDTILPNNARIVAAIKNSEINFKYGWDIRAEMREFEIHSTSFRENCLFIDKVNDYKTFPKSFPLFIKSKLGFNTETVASSGLEQDTKCFNWVLENNLKPHDVVEGIEEINQGLLVLNLTDGREVKVFKTYTYFVTEFTVERILELDPAIDAILCYHPYGSYTDDAKKLCISKNIGLFKTPELMGNLRKTGTDFVTSIIQSEVMKRIRNLELRLRNKSQYKGLEVYAYGSYLRSYLYNDIDLIVVYSGAKPMGIESHLNTDLGPVGKKLDILVCSIKEFHELKLISDNRKKLI